MDVGLTPPHQTLLSPFKDGMSNSAQTLRVGIVLDQSKPLRPWMDTLLAHLRQIPGTDVHLLAIATQSASASKRPAWLIDRLYSASRSRFDPFGDVAHNGADSAVVEPVDNLRSAGCGVIIWLADCQYGPDVDIRNIAKYGVFTVRFGERNQAIPFWDEVANGSATSTATIFWHDSSFAQGRVVRKAETSTLQGLFVTANAKQPLAATIQMLGALCIDIRDAGPQFDNRVRDLEPQELARVDQHNQLSNFDASRFLLKKLTRSGYLRWTTRGKHLRWFVAIRPNTGGSITDRAGLDLTGFQEVALPTAVQGMADPFLWEAGGKQFLLFEEGAEAGQSRARIGCVEVGQNGCSDMKIILERPYHISYPCVVSSNNDLFLLPETSQANRVELYRFTHFPWEMELAATPIEGVALADTTPVFVEDRWYVFTTTVEPFMETLLFSATSLEGPWSLHPSSPVSTSVRSCRSAGQLFWRNGRLFRPTQDCSVSYGYAITVNEVTKLTPQIFEERTVNSVLPSWMPNLMGTHTWNESSAFQVIDGVRYVR